MKREARLPPSATDTILSATRMSRVPRCARAVAFAVLLLVAAGGPATAVALDDLYQAQTIVTGEGEPNRLLGFGRCLGDVLIKVSGDPRLIDDARVGVLAGHADALVRDFRYRDLMAGIPKHDEQGSRERPYELTVDFAPEKIDAALRSLGREPWTAARPRLVVFLSVRSGATDYVLASDGARGVDQRDALAAAAKQRGMPVALPSLKELEEAGLKAETLRAAEIRGLDAAARRLGGDLALEGRMAWDETALGWIADWRLASAGKAHKWRTRTATFDDAFRSAIGGAAQILSGHGEPR